MKLPLFPLNTLLFPGGLLNLRIFEPRYLDMVSRCMKTQTGFGLCPMRRNQSEELKARLYGMGTECFIVDWERLADGMLGILVEGKRRFQVQTVDVEQNNLQVGKVEIIAPLSDESSPLPEEFAGMAELLRRILKRVSTPYADDRIQLDNAYWVSARLTEFLPLPLSLKNMLFEMDDTTVRLHHLHDNMGNLGT